MIWRPDPTSPFRRVLALVLLTVLANAAALHADECEAVDENDQPRDCTLSERLGKCGYEAWESWKTCVDNDEDGEIDLSFLEQQYCNFFAAIDLGACAVVVPWELISS